MRKLDIDIDALVATGPAGVRTALTALSTFQPSQGNFHPYARITRHEKEASASRACFSWTDLVVPHGTTTATIWDPTIIPQFRTTGGFQADSLVAIAQNASVVAGHPVVQIWRGARGAPLSAQSLLAGFTVTITVVSIPAARVEFRVSPTAIVVLPGETLSVRCTTTAGADAFDALSVQLYGRTLHMRR